MIELERTDRGRIAVERDVLEGLVRSAAKAVQGVSLPRGGGHLRVRADGAAVSVELAVSVEGGLVLPAVGREVQASVAAALATALGVRPRRVDVAIESIHPAGA